MREFPSAASAAATAGTGTRPEGERYQHFMHHFIDSALREIGPRESCSHSERRLGQRLAQLWNDLGLEVRTEPFECHPKAFLGFIPFIVLLDLAAVVAYWVSPLLCFLLAGAAFAVSFFEIVRYRELVDFLFPRQRGENVLAIVRPRGQARRRVVVSAHQDSAYEVTLWFLLGTSALPIMLLGFAAAPITMIAGLAKFLAGGASPFLDGLGYLCMGLYPFAGMNFFFHAYMAVPGAMDDLAGISILAGLARVLADPQQARPGVEHTEVVLLATSSEEAGLRGAKRYVEQHAAELRVLPTHGIFVDSVYDERFLTILTAEIFTTARHDPYLIRLAEECAAARGHAIRKAPLLLGATDASAFAQAGLSSVCLVAQDTTRLVPNYHTRLDVIDHVRPESLGITMQLVLDMIGQIDASEKSDAA